MNRFWMRVHCAMARHPLVVTMVGQVGTRYIATHVACWCRHRRQPIFPGCLYAEFQVAYEDYPTEWNDFYAEP